MAIIGAGLQASRRAPAIEKSGDELVVIAAAHEASAKKIAFANGCDYAVGWERVVEREDIDAVLICTPPKTHFPIATAAMRSGKRVLCEKPLAMNSREAKEMLEFAVKNAGILKCGFNLRYHPSLQKTKNSITNGELGEIYYITASYGIGARPGYESEWKANPKFISGGELMDHGIHLVDLAEWYLGDVSEVFAVTMNYHVRGMPFEDNAFVTLKTNDGMVTFIHASLTQWINRFLFEVVGSEGYARISGLGGSYGVETLTIGRKEPEKPFSYTITEFRGDDRCWEEEWRDFKLSTPNQSYESALGGVRALEIVEAAYKSAMTGSMIRIQPQPT